MITSHFWLEIPLKLQHQTIQIKALVCDSECPYDLILGRTSMAQSSAWQDYATNKLYICHATGMEEDPKVTLDIQCLW